MSKVGQWLRKQWYGEQAPAFCDECGQYTQDAQLVGYEDTLGGKGGEKIFWCQNCYARLKDSLV